MRSPFVLLGCLAALGGAAQTSRFTYRDRSGNLSVQAASGGMVRLPVGYRLSLQGLVTMSSKTQGLTMRARSVEADIVGDSTLSLKSLTATGTVEITRSGGYRQTQLTGSKGTYQAGSSSDRVTMSGPVRLTTTDAAKRQTISATGANGSAVLANAGALKGTLTTAKLVGSVKVTLLEFRPDGKQSKIIVTGNQMDVNNQGSPTVVVSGHVAAAGEGASTLGSFTNLSKMTFQLNKTGEVVGFQSEAGS